MSFAYGKFYQNPEDEYLVQTKNLDFEQADHYLLNYLYMGNGHVFRVEGYYKDYDKLFKTKNNQFNNAGSGYAHGIDLFWKDRKTIKDVDYWVSYSYLNTKRGFRNYPVSSIPPFAGKHTLNVVYKQFFEKVSLQVGATYTYATGRTYFNPNNPVYIGDKTINNQNLSLSVSYLTRVFNQFTVIYTSINNIPGFKNVYGYNYSDNGQNRLAVQPPARRNFFVGMFIAIGDNTFVR